MKLDLLKKLTALANNNPNENEANLAARKVCLMLAEAKFNLGNGTPVAKTAPKSSHSGSGTWNDVKRSEEPEFKSTRQEPNFRSASNPTGPDPFWDFFERFYSPHEPRDPYKEPWVKPPAEPEEKRQSNYDPFRNPFDDVFSFDLDDIIGKQVNVKIPRQDPKGFKESKAKNYNPIDDTLEFSCIRCKNWFRVSKATFEELRGCVVCANCGSKSK